MKNDLLNLLYKLRKEETLSKENTELINEAIDNLESASSVAEIKEIALLFLRIFLNHFNPDDWDVFK